MGLRVEGWQPFRLEVIYLFFSETRGHTLAP